MEVFGTSIREDIDVRSRQRHFERRHDARKCKFWTIATSEVDCKLSLGKLHIDDDHEPTDRHRRQLLLKDILICGHERLVDDWIVEQNEHIIVNETFALLQHGVENLFGAVADLSDADLVALNIQSTLTAIKSSFMLPVRSEAGPSEDGRSKSTLTKHKCQRRHARRRQLEARCHRVLMPTIAIGERENREYDDHCAQTPSP